MSLNKTQIDALIDRNCKSDSSSYPLADKTADENLAIDFIFDKIFKVNGTWQFDDSNHTDYPIIMTNLIQGQRDYSFITDEQGNLILDIYKVLVADKEGRYYEILPVDVESESVMNGFFDGQDLQGYPIRYDKTANGIFLDAIPDYNYTNGLKIYINREGSHFIDSDTTKMPGFAGSFHEYIALRPSHFYCKRNGMFDLSDQYKRDMIEMENAIETHYSSRNKDEKVKIIPKWRSSR